MGTSSSKFEFSHGLRQSLRDIPFQAPTDADLEFLSYQTGIYLFGFEKRAIFKKKVIIYRDF